MPARTKKTDISINQEENSSKEMEDSFTGEDTAYKIRNRKYPEKEKGPVPEQALTDSVIPVEELR